MAQSTTENVRHPNSIWQPHGDPAKARQPRDPPEEDPFVRLYDDTEFYDDNTGLPLSKAMATQAHRIEIVFLSRRRGYTPRCVEKIMKVLTTRWLDINKGDENNPDYRSRLAGREREREKSIAETTSS